MPSKAQIAKIEESSRKVEEPILPLSSNGHGPRMERHFTWLPIEDYPGYEVRAWVNPKQRVMLDVDSADTQFVLAAIKELIVDVRTVWEGKTYDTWFDCDGEPLPKPGDDSFIEMVPTELLAMALRVIRIDGPRVLGNAYLTRRQRRV